MDPRLVAVAEEALPRRACVAVPSATVAAALRATGRTVVTGPLERLPDDRAGAVALLDDELSTGVSPGRRVGDHAEGLLAEAARVLRPGGLLAASVRNAVHAAAAGAGLGRLRGWTADELGRALGQRGFLVQWLCAPGAAAALRGDPVGQVDLELDRRSGLLDAAERTVAVGRLAGDRAGRSAAFFTSLPRKVVAAAVLCRDAQRRVLVVHDSFKQHWTIPGGVVDADEDPHAAARREAWEEAGVHVEVGALLGVFAASWPDRLTLVYAATPSGPVEPAPVHAHEIDAAAWLGLEEALAEVAPHVAEQIRRCLDTPGGSWRQ